MQQSAREKIIYNLKDCDCDNDMIDRFMAKFDAGLEKDALKLLAEHRKNLLEQFHKCNDRIGCLDYLVYQIENKVVSSEV